MTCECQNCEKEFEIEIKENKEVICPYCYSGDIIIYKED